MIICFEVNEHFVFVIYTYSTCMLFVFAYVKTESNVDVTHLQHDAGSSVGLVGQQTAANPYHVMCIYRRPST